MGDVFKVGETVYFTRRCPSCGVEREEEENLKRTLVCCGVPTSPIRCRLVATLSDGRKVETLTEEGQRPVTRFVGNSDG